MHNAAGFGRVGTIRTTILAVFGASLLVFIKELFMAYAAKTERKIFPFIIVLALPLLAAWLLPHAITREFQRIDILAVMIATFWIQNEITVKLWHRDHLPFPYKILVKDEIEEESKPQKVSLFQFIRNLFATSTSAVDKSALITSRYMDELDRYTEDFSNPTRIAAKQVQRSLEHIQTMDKVLGKNKTSFDGMSKTEIKQIILDQEAEDREFLEALKAGRNNNNK